MDFSSTAKTLEAYHTKNSEMYNVTTHEIVLETVGYQAAMEGFLQQNSTMEIIGKKPIGSKRERLILTTNFIRTGRICFPNTEAGRMLAEQIV